MILLRLTPTQQSAVIKSESRYSLERTMEVQTYVVWKEGSNRRLYNTRMDKRHVRFCKYKDYGKHTNTVRNFNFKMRQIVNHCRGLLWNIAKGIQGNIIMQSKYQQKAGMRPR